MVYDDLYLEREYQQRIAESYPRTDDTEKAAEWVGQSFAADVNDILQRNNAALIASGGSR